MLNEEDERQQLYGLTGTVQPVNPAWGVEGFDPFIPGGIDRKSTRLNSSHRSLSRMPSSA